MSHTSLLIASQERDFYFAKVGYSTVTGSPISPTHLKLRDIEILVREWCCFSLEVESANGAQKLWVTLDIFIFSVSPN